MKKAMLGSLLFALALSSAASAEPVPTAPRCDLKAVQGQMVSALLARLGQFNIVVSTLKTHLQSGKVVDWTQRYELYTSIEGTMQTPDDGNTIPPWSGVSVVSAVVYKDCRVTVLPIESFAVSAIR